MRQKGTGITFFVFVFILVFWAQAAAAAAGPPDDYLAIKEKTEEIIGEGAVLSTYLVQNKLDNQLTKVFVLKLDLTNPYLEIKSLIGTDGTLAGRATVSQLAAARENTVAVVNGGFFVPNDGKPVGVLIADDTLVSSPNMRDDMPAFALDKKLLPFFGFFRFTGEVKAANGKTYPLFGVNKTAYNLKDGSPSDANHLTLYDRRWGKTPRGAHPDYPEAMVARVENNVVREVLPAKDARFEIPANGYVLWGAGAAAEFIRQNLLAGQPVAVSYRTVPDYQNFKLATGSNSFLVQNAQVARFQEELKGKTARTAVGTSREGKDLYFVVVEKSPQSNGMEQKDLAVFLVRLGIEEAVNLDGGGSTTLAARRLGDQEPTLINQPKEGRERKIPDAIGIFNTAPPGEPKGLLIAGPDRVVAGTEAEFSVKGYDSHFHPWTPKNIQWVYPEGTVPKKENIYKNVFYIEGEGPREVLLSASAQGISTSKKVKVVRFADIRTLKVTPAEIAAKRGEAVSLSFQVVTEDGEAIPVDGRFVSCRATIGTVKNGIFEAGQQRGQGEITAAFGGREAKVPVKIECLFKDTVGSWAFEQIEDLAAAGLVKGYADGTFQPAQPVTRAEMTALLARVFNWPPSSREAGFRDEIPAWAKEAISSAAARGIIKGYPDGTFRPGNYITRAELCGILDRALSLKTTQTKPRFKDGDQIPAWAAESVERVAAAGLIRGYEDGTLRPEARVTRAEIAVILWRQLHGAS